MRLTVPLALVLGALLASAGAGSAQTPRVVDPAAVDTTEGVLKPGDKVEVRVWRREDMSGVFDIAPDGTIVHPLYNAIKVGGLTPDQAEEQMRVFLLEYEQKAEFIMQPLLKVSVAGEVNSPDVYELPPGTTLARALTLAGGVTAEGRLDRLRLTRNGRRLAISLWGENGQPQMTVRSGDEIFIERRKTVMDMMQTVSYSLNMLTFFFGVYQTFVRR